MLGDRLYIAIMQLIGSEPGFERNADRIGFGITVVLRHYPPDAFGNATRVDGLGRQGGKAGGVLHGNPIDFPVGFEVGHRLSPLSDSRRSISASELHVSFG